MRFPGLRISDAWEKSWQTYAWWAMNARDVLGSQGKTNGLFLALIEAIAKVLDGIVWIRANRRRSTSRPFRLLLTKE